MQCEIAVYCRIADDLKLHRLLVILHRDRYFRPKENRDHFPRSFITEQAIAIAIDLNHVTHISKPSALAENAIGSLC